ncbi:MAG: hypothetical protein LC685_03375 [Actinobacteria bacterium]|nr:hypothetical protein [Actinomycetota bacterium]
MDRGLSRPVRPLPLGARYYDPNLGRWTQQDSVVSLGDPANGNRYVYAGDDPVSRLDPMGRD